MKRLIIFVMLAGLLLPMNTQASWVDDHLFDDLGENYDLIWQKAYNELCPYQKVVLKYKEGKKVALAKCLTFDKDGIFEEGPAWVSWEIGTDDLGMPRAGNHTLFSLKY